MNLFVQESGKPNAPTIVFLHGGGGGGWMWQPQVEALQGDYHLLVPDLPEHGQSMEVELTSIADCGRRIAALIQERAHGGQAHVVGLSLGAQVLVALLAEASELVNRALISSASLRPAPGAWMYTPGVLKFAYLSSVAPFKSNDWWINLNSKYAGGIPERYYPQAKLDFQRMTEASWVHLMTTSLGYRLPVGLTRVTAPTLVVAAQGEYASMKESVRDLVKAIPTARGCLVAHRQKLAMAQQHNWSLNTPELFTRTVRAWIEDQPLPEELKPIG